MSQSKDLKTWSQPVKVSKGDGGFSSSMVQLKDRSLVIAYNSYNKNGIMASTSKDGKKWSSPKRIVRFPREMSVRLRLEMLFNKLTIVYGNDHVASMMTAKGTRWSKPTTIYAPAVFETAAVELDSDTLGIASFPEGEGPRNILFDTIQAP